MWQELSVNTSAVEKRVSTETGNLATATVASICDFVPVPPQSWKSISYSDLIMPLLLSGNVFIGIISILVQEYNSQRLFAYCCKITNIPLYSNHIAPN